MHSDRLSRSHILKDPQAVIGTDVPGVHFLSGVVSTNRHERQIERPEVLADLLEGWTDWDCVLVLSVSDVSIARIATEPNFEAHHRSCCCCCCRCVGGWFYLDFQSSRSRYGVPRCPRRTRECASCLEGVHVGLSYPVPGLLLPLAVSPAAAPNWTEISRFLHQSRQWK